jgi:tetratricopeptide (TPR) repeat protein
MPRRFIMVRWLLIVLLTVVVGCSQSLYMQGKRHLARGEYDPAIEAFNKEISANPTSARAWRELGVTFYEQGNLIKAEDALKQANNIKPDARTNRFLGLVYERQENYEKAIKAYTTSLSLQSRGKTASLTRAHLDRLVSRKMEADVSKALADEANINVDTIPQNTIAVVNFDGSHLPADLAPLAQGLAEFTAIDLAKVHSLTVVERQKLDVLLKELEFGASGYVDPATAPRLGRLMGSRKLVTGTVLGIGDEGLELDGAIVNTADSSMLRPEEVEGRLSKFFQVQKDFVFEIIKELGISLSAAERDSIEQVPTESYLAFLAYSRGLDYQRRGNYVDAKQAFSEAVRLDENFQQAESQLETVADPAAAELSYQQALDQYEGAVRDEGEGQSEGLDARLTTVAQNTGTSPSSERTTPIEMPVVRDATVKIKGNPDAP